MPGRRTHSSTSSSPWACRTRKRRRSRPRGRTVAGDRAEPDLTIEVFPPSQPVSLPDTGFAADGHLGRLAAYLRMLGFDVWCEQSADDAEIAAIAKTDARCVLTRDAGLLKRKEVEQGYFVRSQRPREQLSEVVRRFGLEHQIQPFTRCMECNGVLATAAKDEVEGDVPPRVRALHTEFSRCTKCRKVYWRGSHWARMAG